MKGGRYVDPFPGRAAPAFRSSQSPALIVNGQEYLSHWGYYRVGYTFASMDMAAGEGARFELASDQSLLVYFDQQNKKGRAPDKVPDMVGTGATSSARSPQSQITLQANEKVRKLLRLLQLEPVAGVRNLHPAYCSLLVKFDGLRLRHEEVEAVLRE
ncbi:MAG: hypothetical protein DMG49_14820 [Acidobacteria bacterium]|nr:MAG: hypothetical protein DMG49_14820 [Acidobacteriota bacterium]